MESTPDAETPGGESGGERGTGLPTAVVSVADWAVPLLLALLGLALVVAGAAVLVANDPDTIGEAVADGTLQSDVFSDADLVDVTVATLRWTGIGLVVTGALGWVGAAAYVVYRRRLRRREAATGAAAPDGVTNAIAGAAVSVVVAFVPLSSAVGGFVAGYLHGQGRAAATRVGALSGLFAVLPVAVLALFLVGGLAAGVADVGATAGALLLVGGVLFALLSTVAVTVGLGAVGGYVAARVVERRDHSDGPGGVAPDSSDAPAEEPGPERV